MHRFYCDVFRGSCHWVSAMRSWGWERAFSGYPRVEPHHLTHMKGSFQCTGPDAQQMVTACEEQIFSVMVYFTLQSTDFTNREHLRHTSINKLKYENERLRNDLAKLHANGKSAWANQTTRGEMGWYAYQSPGRMDNNEDRYADSIK